MGPVGKQSFTNDGGANGPNFEIERYHTAIMWQRILGLTFGKSF
jgi:hypothetical protein